LKLVKYQYINASIKIFSLEAYPIFRSFKKYLARLGLVAFAFFFFKGLAWIAVFYFGSQFFK